MSAGDAVGVSADHLQLATRGLQLLLAGIAAFALATLDLGLLVNSAVPLSITFLPTLLERRHGHGLNAGLALWITAAAFLHAAGSLGPYETIGWYDQLTHTLSATLVAGVGYALVQAVDRHHDDVYIPPKLHFLFIVVFVLAFGVLWEILEFALGGAAALVGGDAALTQYGLRDTVMDLVFDAVGGLLVALWGTGHFDGLARLFSRRMGGAGSDR